MQSVRLAFPVSLLLMAATLAASAPAAPTAGSALTLPAGTLIDAAVVRPLWSKLAAPGAGIYAQTTFPVTVDGRIAIPPGTYVEGTIEKLTRPTRRSQRAVIEVLFTQIVFANGYVALLPPLPAGANGVAAAEAPIHSSAGPSASPSAGSANAPSLIDVTIQATTSNDLLLDNGAAIDVTLAAPLTLEAAQVAAAAPLSRAPQPGQFKSASLCVPIPGSPGTPGTPGTPDTVIPGTPGTPDTVIPGSDGMPDTVIPGTPATPDTVIPGSPGTPGTPGFPGYSCPAPPMVISCTLVAPAQTAAQQSGANQTDAGDIGKQKKKK